MGSEMCIRDSSPAASRPGPALIRPERHCHHVLRGCYWHASPVSFSDEVHKGNKLTEHARRGMSARQVLINRMSYRSNRNCSSYCWDRRICPFSSGRNNDGHSGLTHQNGAGKYFSSNETDMVKKPTSMLLELFMLREALVITLNAALIRILKT